VYQPRTYRHWTRDADLVSFKSTVKETDLYVRAQKDLEPEATRATLECRSSLEEYIATHPDFLTSLEPVPVPETAPEIVRDMAIAAQQVGVGPMAAVAGAIAERVGRDLIRFSPEVVVENGGDIFIKATRKMLVGVYAGDSPFTGNIALEIEPNETPLGVCTSSGTVGHSLSYGAADAVIVLSPSTALADAAATAIANLISEGDDIATGIEFARNVEGLKGLVIIVGERLGAWGEVRICSVQAAQPVAQE
jgi:ApbE superfamily uncharacterized protein (UPF0280 family)